MVTASQLQNYALKKSRSRRNGIQVSFERQGGSIVALRLGGHAGFAAAGEDIVCAAVSALVLSAAHGLREHCGVHPRVANTSKQFRIDVLNGGNQRAQAVLETAVSGLTAIAAAYPGYMRIKQAKLAAGRESEG